MIKKWQMALHWIINTLKVVIMDFSALTRLGIRKSIRPVKNWVMLYLHGYLYGARCRWFGYRSADATATPSSLASVKYRTVYLLVVGIPRLSWKKRPLNVRVCACARVHACARVRARVCVCVCVNVVIPNEKWLIAGNTSMFWSNICTYTFSLD